MSQPVKVPSSKIKDAIGTLCQFLTISGCSHISPETFRQAKFNKTEAVHQLLLLLAELLEFSTSMQFLKLSELDQDDLIYTVHSGMLTRCFRRQQFYLCLDLDKSACNSSRELLIAIGWLVCSEKLLKQMFLKENVSLPTFPDIPHKLQVSKHLMNTSQDVVDSQRSLEEYLNGLVWSIGKCRMATKQLYWKQQEVVRLAHKIHIDTQGISFGKNRVCLSPADVFVLRYKDELKKHLERLEQENKRLQVYSQWLEKEDIFWQWMESVIDADISAQKPAEGSATGLSDCNYPVDDYLKTLDDLSFQIKANLKEITHKVHYYGSPFMKSHPNSTKQQEQFCDKEVDANLDVFKDEARELLNVRFEFVPKKVKEQSSKIKVHSRSDLSSDEDMKDIKDELRILSKKLVSLEERLSEQRDSYSCLCSDMLTSISGVVSIPPITCNHR